MAQQPSLTSNNPFRRKASVPSAPAAPPPAVPRFADVDDGLRPDPETAPALPPADHFRTQLQALSTTNQPPPTTSFQKPKVVKKVRVQSPPPSPESPDPSDRFPPLSLDGDESSSSDETDEQVEQLDPFTYASSTGSTDSFHRGDETQSIPTLRPPVNPFQKTLQDLEHGQPEQSTAPAPGTKGALDVGAFGRLLLTGQAGSVGSAQTAAPNTQHAAYPPIPSGNGANTADTPMASRLSRVQAVQETPQTSRETSEHETEDDRRGLISSSQSSLQPAPTIIRKKPPPPSSRHGKLIRPGAGGEEKAPASGTPPPLSSPARRTATLPLAPPSRQRPPTPSDVNKPLPLAPLKSPADEDSESVFDREAAGKLPDAEIQPGLNIIMPRPPTPPNVSHAFVSVPAATPQPSKKPAPPPRRQPHGRSESKVTPSAALAIQHDDTDSPLRRSSVDSTRSRSSSLRVSIHAPAPPPPRRPSHQSRASSLHSLPPSNASPGDAEPSPLSHTIVPSPPPITDTPTPSNSSGGTPGASAPFPPPPVTVNPTDVNHHHHHHLPTAPAPAPASAPAAGKLAPPPPPPARNHSVRSGRGKRLTGGSTLPPPPLSASDAGRPPSRRSSGREPPPPPRHRDARDARDTRDNSGLGAAAAVSPSTVGAGGGGGGGGGVAGGVDGAGGGGVVGPVVVEDASHAGDILADLSALQREVDALRGQVEH